MFRARSCGQASHLPLPPLQTQECVTGRQCHQEQSRNADREACLPQVSILLRRLSLPRFPLQENGTSGLLCYCPSHFYFPIPLYCSNTLEHAGSASQGSQNKKTFCQPWRQGGRAELGVPDAHPLEQRPQRVRVNCPHNQPPHPSSAQGPSWAPLSVPLCHSQLRHLGALLCPLQLALQDDQFTSHLQTEKID